MLLTTISALAAQQPVIRTCAKCRTAQCGDWGHHPKQCFFLPVDLASNVKMQFEVKYHWSNHYSALTRVKYEFVQHHRGGFWNSNIFEGGACFNSEYFLGGKKNEALTAAASYQELAGFLCWPKRSWGICVFIRLATWRNEQEGNSN